MTLTEFLTARLDEDESAALAAAKYPGKDWTTHPGRDNSEAVVFEDAGSPIAWIDIPDAMAVAGHMASHDPRRVLREVEAKRRILADYENQYGYDLPEGVAEGRDPDERMRDQASSDALGIVAADLAAVYSDHPDYNPDWSEQ